MSLSEKTMNHPSFWRFNATAGDMLKLALQRHGFTFRDLNAMEAHAGRVVDELTTLLMRVEKAREKSA